MNKHLTLVACPVCRDSCFLVSMDHEQNVWLECAKCPPAPAAKLTKGVLELALLGNPEELLRK